MPENKSHSITEPESQASAYKLSKQWIGCAGDLPEDLSHNKKYMEGYGRSQNRSNKK